jgi:hypothetical protein
MPQDDGWLQRDVSEALRRRSVEGLQLAFGEFVRFENTDPGWDPRDAMISLTIFVDCARRLGVDPVVVLGSTLATGPDWLRQTFDGFVSRTDVTLAAFGWTLINTPDGPAYRVADDRPPPVTLPNAE